MTSYTSYRVERNAMILLLIALQIFAFWTIAHQIATFASISWINLYRSVAWSLPVVVIYSYYYGERFANLYVKNLPNRTSANISLANTTTIIYCVLFLAICVLLRDFFARYFLVMCCFVAMFFIAWHNPINKPKLNPNQFEKDSLNSWLVYLLLFFFSSITVIVVLCSNRPDFDDAEYIQFAIQTLRNPERGLYTFDASLGEILDQFRFAPYRITSYETFIGLITQLLEINVLDVYYLVLPGISAVLSILVAFVFFRWFLPLKWSLVAIFVFLLISFSWGETHVAFGNRMYVRLFQGKGLLVAITTPLTILMSLIWMRRPSLTTWLGLLLLQVVAIGVSSSGLVITLFATFLGLVAGFFSNPLNKNYRVAILGSITLAYPISLGLWIKYLSSATGKVEEIGTYLPVNASFGTYWREALVLTILITACFITVNGKGNIFKNKARSNQHIEERSFFWLVFFSFLIIMNPFLIDIWASITSKNMNWRLAWSIPVPLLLALSLVNLFNWSIEHNNLFLKKIGWLLPLTLLVAFLIGTWTLSKKNQVQWGVFEHKLPPEYQQAVDLAETIRKKVNGEKQITVLVDPKVGTWLTVVAPDFRLIMPGHGYRVTLVTIMEKKDFAQRNYLINNLVAIGEGDPSYDQLLDIYKVNVIAIKKKSSLEKPSFNVQVRSF